MLHDPEQLRGPSAGKASSDRGCGRLTGGLTSGPPRPRQAGGCDYVWAPRCLPLGTRSGTLKPRQRARDLNPSVCDPFDKYLRSGRLPRAPGRWGCPELVSWLSSSGGSPQGGVGVSATWEPHSQLARSSLAARHVSGHSAHTWPKGSWAPGRLTGHGSARTEPRRPVLWLWPPCWPHRPMLPLSPHRQWPPCQAEPLMLACRQHVREP